MPKILSKDPCDNKTERLSSPLLAQWVTQGPKGNQVQLKRKFSPKTLNQTASQGDMHMVFFFFCPWCHVVRGHDPVFSGAGRMGFIVFLFFSLFFIFDVRNDTVLYGGYLPMGLISFVYTYCSCFVVVRYCGVNPKSWGNATRFMSLKLA